MSETDFKTVESRSEAEALLREHGVTPTRQRVEIARLLFSRPQHFSADNVAGSLTEEGAAVSKATVYNTLGLFVKKGLIREIVADPERSLYDSNMTPHHHFYDPDRGHIEDVECDGIGLTAMPEPPPGARIEGVDIVVRIRRDNA